MKIIVINIRDKLVLTVKLDEANTLGMIRKIENGFKIPPDRYNNKLNCTISTNKKLKDIWFESWISLTKEFKKILLSIPNITTIFANIKLNSNFKIKVTIFIVNNWPNIPIHLKLR